MTTKKILFVYSFDEDKHPKKPAFSDLDLRAFQMWFRQAKENNLEAHLVFYKNININQKNITKYWTIKGDNWVRNEDSLELNSFSLILDRIISSLADETKNLRAFLAKQVKMINNPELINLIGNKISQYILFSEFMPTTVLVNSIEELNTKIDQIKTEKVVIKPFAGEGGKDVSIIDKKQILNSSKIAIKPPFIMQDFIESTRGVPNFDTEENIVADLRIVSIDNNLVYAISRKALPNSLLTNVAQGGIVRIVDIELIPQEVVDICHKVTSKLGFFSPTSLSIDFMFDNNYKPHLIEINTKPGGLVLLEAGKELQDKYFQRFVLDNLN